MKPLTQNNQVENTVVLPLDTWKRIGQILLQSLFHKMTIKLDDWIKKVFFLPSAVSIYGEIIL